MRDEAIDALDGPFEDGLQGAVAVVASPARDPLLEREAANRVSEKHSLDPPMDDDTASHPVTLTRLVPSSCPMRIESFVRDLAAARIGATFNFYRDGDGASLRRARLAAYLAARADARLLLVGEAAGYRGARVSGIPFTSERQLSGGPPGEATASIVHRVLAELALVDDVVLWNVVPTHPHKPGRPESNRPPTRGEIDAGAPFLAELARDRIVLPVGRVAHGLVGGTYIRHPSHGGASAFRATLLDYAAW